MPDMLEALGVDAVATEVASVTERTRALASLRAPCLVPVLGVQRLDRSLWLVSELDHGVTLNRLLELTRPTPAQAVLIGLDVVRGVRTLHAADSAHGRVSGAEVRIGGDGQVRLDGWAAGILFGSTEPLDGRQRVDLVDLGMLLTDLAQTARGSPSATDERALALLAALDAAADYAALPGADVELVAGPLEARCGPEQDAAVSSELAALVAAATASGSAPASPSAPPGISGSAQGTSRTPRTARLAAVLRTLWRRTWTWLVALIVLVSVVAVEFMLLHDRLTHDVRLLLGGGREAQDTESPAGPSAAELPPVDQPAPARAGAVDGLDLRALQPCTPGAVCVVRVLARLHPRPRPQTVEWTFHVVDRCTGNQHSAPGGAVSVAAGATQAQAVSTVGLPPGQALAVIAVTSEPAGAASQPLPVPARRGLC